MAQKWKHVFDGTEVTGTLEQLQSIAKSMGCKLTNFKTCPRGYYPSKSKGMMKISEMNDWHIRRALVKRSTDYLNGIYDNKNTNSEFLSKFAKLIDDQVVSDLFTELKKRK